MFRTVLFEFHSVIQFDNWKPDSQHHCILIVQNIITSIWISERFFITWNSIVIFTAVKIIKWKHLISESFV